MSNLYTVTLSKDCKSSEQILSSFYTTFFFLCSLSSRVEAVTPTLDEGVAFVSEHFQVKKFIISFDCMKLYGKF